MDLKDLIGGNNLILSSVRVLVVVVLTGSAAVYL
jgi:hypothetical protein